MKSNKDWLMQFVGGLFIHADKNIASSAYAWDPYWVHP